MTAIFGIWNFGGDDCAANFSRMESALLRYGSDGHESLAPMSGLKIGRHLHMSLTEDCFRTAPTDNSRYAIVADVRLTERDDLISQLQLGEGAAQMSDAAIAAAAIERWNEEAFNRIYGAFAIAAWDKRDARFLLARDHLGLKPLFFHSTAAFFAFASMPDGLHALPEVPLGPDMESMKLFLAAEFQSSGKTHFEGIQRVMPGHFAVVTKSDVSQKRYWVPDLTPLRLHSHEDYARELSERLDKAVAAALRGAEGEVGAHLSSGFDSTAVATSAAMQLAGKGRVFAYTSAPREGYESTLPDRIADESILAGATAGMYPNMEHVVIRSDRTPMAHMRRTASIYAVQVFNICNEGWYDAINDDAAKRGITVMLEGGMGNATLSESGMLALGELVRAGRIGAWLGLVFRILRKRSVGLSKILWNSFNAFIPEALHRRLIERRYGPVMSPSRNSALRDEHLQAILRGTAGKSTDLGGKHRHAASAWGRSAQSSIHERLFMLSGDDSGPSCKGILGEWKIDYRDPTVDRRLVEFSLRVPVEELIHDGQPKALLRRVLSGRAPAAVLDNRRKGYQAADWHEWLDSAREELAGEVERIEMFGPTAELIDVERLRRLVDSWPEKGSNSWTTYEGVVDYRVCLLRAVSAASFMRQAARSNY